MLNSIFVGRVPMAIAVIVASVLPIWLLEFRPSDASLVEGPIEQAVPVEQAASVEQAVPPAPPEVTGPVPINRKIRISRGADRFEERVEADTHRAFGLCGRGTGRDKSEHPQHQPCDRTGG